jgi:hypothetical protein
MAETTRMDNEATVPLQTCLRLIPTSVTRCIGMSCSRTRFRERLRRMNFPA